MSDSCLSWCLCGHSVHSMDGVLKLQPNGFVDHPLPAEGDIQESIVNPEQHNFSEKQGGCTAGLS